jgi:hypothetical protein
VDRFSPDVTVEVRDERARVVEHRAGTCHRLHPDLALLMGVR